MSLINNRFLSLTGRVQAKIKAKQKEESTQKELTNNSSDAKKEETSSQNLQQFSNTKIDNNLLLTYRGININHIDTALEKATVSGTQTGLKSQNEKPVMPTVDKSVISKSSIASDYKNSTTRTGVLGLKTSSKLSAIKNLATSDLYSVAEAIKAQLKKTLGSNYDAKSVQESINEAIEKTIKTFEQNTKTRRSGGYNVADSENAFVYKKKSIFGSVGKYMYNVEALANTFLESYNTIASSKFEKALNDVQNSVNNVKNELLQKKDEIAQNYMRSIPSSLLYSFDTIYESALNEINKDNFQNANVVIENYLNEKLGTISGSSAAEIKSNADNLLSVTKDYYEERYSGIYEDNSFSNVFNEAKEEVLKNINTSDDCSASEIANKLDSQVKYLVNNYMDKQLEQAVEVPKTMTRSIAAAEAPVVTSLRNIPKEPTVTTAKYPNGSTITVTNYSFYYRNTSIIQTMKDKDGIHYPNATIEMTLPNGEKYSINVGIENLNDAAKRNPDNQTPPISAIDQLAQTLGSLQQGVLDSFCKEIHYVKIQDANNTFAGMYTYDETMTLTYREEKKGDYGQVLSPKINNINGYVITHELGHAIDYNKDSASQMKAYEDAFNQIKNSSDYKKFVKDELYAMTDVNEFFAEYYTYKKYGTTSKQGQKLFKELEKDAQKNPSIKNLLDSMNKMISDTEKLSKEQRQSEKMSQYDLQAATERAKKEAVKQKEQNTNTNTDNTQNGHLLPNPTEPQTPIEKPAPTEPVSPSDPIKPVEPNIPDNTHTPEEFEKPSVPAVNEKPTTDTSKPEKSEENTKTDTEELPNNDTKDKEISESKPSVSEIPDKESNNTTVENGKETYKPFEQKPGSEGIGTLPTADAETLSQQKAQELYEKYGNGYDIKVDAIKNPDGTITVQYSVTKIGNSTTGESGTQGAGNSDGKGDGKLPEGPTGNITGNSDAGKTDSNKAPGLDENGHIPTEKLPSQNTNDSNFGIYEGVGIDIKDYMNSRGLIDVNKLMTDWQNNGGEIYSTNDRNAINGILGSYNTAVETNNWNEFYSNVSNIVNNLTKGSDYNNSRLCKQMDEFIDNIGGLSVDDTKYTSFVFRELTSAVTTISSPGGYNPDSNKTPNLNPNNVVLPDNNKSNNNSNLDSGFGKNDRPTDLNEKIPYDEPQSNTNNTNKKPANDNSIKPKNETAQPSVPKNNTNNGSSINIGFKPSTGGSNSTKKPSNSSFNKPKKPSSNIRF